MWRQLSSKNSLKKLHRVEIKTVFQALLQTPASAAACGKYLHPSLLGFPITRGNCDIHDSTHDNTPLAPSKIHRRGLKL